MRQTLSDSGTVLSNMAYDLWGVPQQGSVPTFGLTGEFQQGNAVYLRATQCVTFRIVATMIFIVLFVFQKYSTLIYVL